METTGTEIGVQQKQKNEGCHTDKILESRDQRILGSIQLKILLQTSWVTMAKSFSSSRFNVFQAIK